MIFLRSAVFNLLFLGGSAVAAVAAVPLLLAPRTWLIAYVRGWARAVVAVLRAVCGIRLEAAGLDRIPPAGAIVAAKHQSAFDTVVWLALLPAPAYVLKQELLSIPVWGWLARRCGHVAVDRRGGAAALKRMVRATQALLDAGRPVVIFPEGTRTAPGERRPYQPGVAAIAAATHARVVPVATDSGRCWGRRAFRKEAGTIHVSVLEPLPAGLPRAALMTALQAAIETETDRLLGLAGPVENSGETGPVIPDSGRQRGTPTF